MRSFRSVSLFYLLEKIIRMSTSHAKHCNAGAVPEYNHVEIVRSVTEQLQVLWSGIYNK